METCTQSSSGLLNFNLTSEISHLHACAYMWNVRYQQDSNQSTPPLHLFSLSETRTRPYECVYIHTHGRVHIFVVGLALRWASCWLGDMCNRETSTSSPAGQQFARGRYIKSDNAWCSVIIHRSHIHTWHISICMPFVQSVSSWSKIMVKWIDIPIQLAVLLSLKLCDHKNAYSSTVPQQFRNSRS
jgi:hypothetical protein